MQTPRVTAGLVVFATVFLGCSGTPEAPLPNDEPELPVWLDEVISWIESLQVAHPPLWIARYEYKGEVVYFRPAYHLIPSDLYDSEGELICHPDGGRSDVGDERCPNFFSARIKEAIIWRDQRAPPSVNIVSTRDCSSCGVVVPEGETRVVYITLTTDGLSSGIASIYSAQFRVFGLPEGWSAEARLALDNATPIADSHSDPFGSNGAVVVFEPQAAVGQRCLVLYEVTLRSGGRAYNVPLSVRSNSGRGSPTFTYDDPSWPLPIAPHAVVGGGLLLINSDRECL